MGMLEELHAVQIVMEHVSGSKHSFWSYELNLVLKDGERVNVVDHGDLARIRGDAGRISAMIGCRVWDGTNRAACPPSPCTRGPRCSTCPK